MEEKEKSSLQKETSIAVAIAEDEEIEEQVEEKAEEVDKATIDVQKLREELKKVKEQKRVMYQKERAVVETPNYDFIKEISPEKRKKIYRIEKNASATNSKPFTFNKRLKMILFGLAFFIAGGFCLSSGIQLANASNALQAAQSEYQISLSKLIKNISKTDSGNKALELIETYPDEIETPSSIAKDTNWFDKICNFISGIFGG